MSRIREDGPTQQAVSVKPEDLFTSQTGLSEGARIHREAMERRMIAAEVVALMREEGLAYQTIRKPLKRLRQDGPRKPWITGRDAALILAPCLLMIGAMKVLVMLGWI